MQTKIPTTTRRPILEGTQPERILKSLQELGGPATITQIVEAIGSDNRNSVNATLGKMANDRKLKRVEPGVYDLPKRDTHKPAAKAPIKPPVAPKPPEHLNGTSDSTVSVPLVTPAEKQRRERTVWSDELWMAFANQLFLDWLEDPASGVTMHLLNRSMKKAIPETLWRENISGLSQVPRLVFYLKPLMQNLVDNWLDPQIVEKPVPQAVDVEEVLRHITTERLQALLTERTMAKQNEMFSRFDAFLATGNALLGAISEEVAKKLKIEMRLDQSSTEKEVATVPKMKVFICGVKSGRMAEIKQKLSGFNLDWSGEFVVDSRNTSQVSAKDVPKGCDIYLINAKQSSHVMQQSVFAAVGRDRVKFVNGSHDLESVLRDIHVHGAERVLKMPTHRVTGN
jgi:hypothetical protein